MQLILHAYARTLRKAQCSTFTSDPIIINDGGMKDFFLSNKDVGKEND